MNASFTKLCDDPESSRARNGQRGLRAAWDVSTRKKELGERDVVFKQRWCMLLLCWQPFWRTGRRRLPTQLHHAPDRKITPLNSSHLGIADALFCLHDQISTMRILS